MARNLRQRSQLRVRQPLETLFVICHRDKWAWIQEQEAILLTELNVKKLVLLETEETLMGRILTLNTKQAGPVLRDELGQAKVILEQLDEQSMRRFVRIHEKGGRIVLPGFERPLASNLFSVEPATRSHLEMDRLDDLGVAIDTRLTADLIQEGMARDFIRRVQRQRKDMQLEVQERITIEVAESGPVTGALARHRDRILAETLATSLSIETSRGPDWQEWQLGGETIAVAVSKDKRGQE
jgi:isoleucyl-tRNA synthetase